MSAWWPPQPRPPWRTRVRRNGGVSVPGGRGYLLATREIDGPRDPSAGYLDGMLLEGPDLAAQLPTLLLHPSAEAPLSSCSGLHMVESRYAASSNPTSGQLDRLPRLTDLPCQICADDSDWPAHRLHLGALLSARSEGMSFRSYAQAHQGVKLATRYAEMRAHRLVETCRLTGRPPELRL